MRLLDFHTINIAHAAEGMVSDFYNRCVAELHEEGKLFGVASNGPTFVPELLPLGEMAVYDLLNSQKYLNMYGSHPEVYYYVLISLAIDAGIDIANKWNENCEHLNIYAANIVKLGPEKDADPILTQHFNKKIANNHGLDFFFNIYQKWSLQLEPFWETAYPQPFVFKALLAAYQFGISMFFTKSKTKDFAPIKRFCNTVVSISE